MTPGLSSLQGVDNRNLGQWHQPRFFLTVNSANPGPTSPSLSLLQITEGDLKIQHQAMTIVREKSVET